MKTNKATVQENYVLPSKGVLYKDHYGNEFDGTVTIRSMTTFEEKMRLGNQGFWKTMVNILNAVVTEPEDFNAEDLTLFDFYFMMYKMRTVSYGPIYKVQVTCPHCGKSMISKVNLDALDVQYLDETFREPFTIGPLPRSKRTLTCRFLRVTDSIANERKARDILRDHPDYIGDPDYILTRASEIIGSDDRDEPFLPIEAQMFVESMDAMDSAYFQQAYNKKVDGFGMSMICKDVCESCNESFDFSLPFNSEFFRPTFDI